MIQLPRGCRDFTPEQMEKRRYLENVLREEARRFNFREIMMPTFEHSELFIKKSGEDILRQLYIFQDKGGRSLALRPELTAQAIRFYAQSLQFEAKPQKLFYFGNCFRYERPQKGRYREFWQFGAEIIGTKSPEAAVELLSLAVSMYQRMGLKDYILKVGNVGVLRSIFDLFGLNDEEKKKAFTLLDKDNFQGFEEFLSGQDFQEPEGFYELLSQQWRAEQVLVFKDKIEALVNSIKSNRSKTSITSEEKIPGPERLTLLEKQVKDFCHMLELLAGFCPNFSVDLSVARGLDYYTNMVFEIEVPTLGAESQVCGGGEYSLDSVFEIDSKGCLGFAMGFDRTLLALEAEEKDFPKQAPTVYIIPFPETMSFSLKVLKELRETGISVDIELTGRGLSKAMKHANKQGARYTMVLGEREREQEKEEGLLPLKDMKAKTQHTVPRNKLATFIKDRLKEENEREP